MKMTKKTLFLALLAAIVLSSCAQFQPTAVWESDPRGFPPIEWEPEPQGFQINKNDAAKIGHKIWMNEGAGKEKNLTVWDKDENFASLGIGHFIWYPAGIRAPYQEPFPQLLEFLQQQLVQLPEWLQNRPDCPWNSQDAFHKDINSSEMLSLRKLLKDTIPQQVLFIIKRLEQTLPRMMSVLPTEEQRTYVRQQFEHLAQTPMGIYALIDYMNFKGEGTSETERYQGQGWGLLQVLENMPGNSDNAVAEFVQAADQVLTRRVQNAPIDESHRLVGWRYRLKTYTYDYNAS
ncbi:MAG: hypothetical protein ABFS56_34905 [Pseudomonadota bacterium]